MKIIVSGGFRSGTSMMMRALGNGGIPLWYDEKFSQYKQDISAPNANPEGFFEVNPEDSGTLGFTSTVPDGHAVKLLTNYLPYLTGGIEHKIIYLRRDPYEIIKSYKLAFPMIHPRIFNDWPEEYYFMSEQMKAIIAERADCELLELWLEEIVKDPQDSFAKIRALGIPINVKDAAATVLPFDVP